MSNVLRLAALATGFGMLYIATLLRPAERDRFHHWLETVWIRADDLQKLGMRRQTALARGTVEAAAHLLERVFGKSLLSPQAVSSAVFLSIASAIYWMLIMSAHPWVRVEWNVWLAGLVAVALSYCALSREPELKAAYAWAGWGLSFLAVSWLLGPIRVPGDAERAAMTAVVLALGVLCDLLFVAFMRRSLRKAAGLDSFVSIASMAVLNLVIAAVLCLGPPLLVPGSEGSALAGDPGWPAAIAYLVSMTNTLDVGLSLGLFGLWLLVIMNRMLWHILDRTLYAIAVERLLRHRKLLVVGGLSLIAVGLPGIGHLVVLLREALFPR